MTDSTVYPRCERCGNMTMSFDGICFRCRCDPQCVTPWKVRTRFGSYTAEGYGFWWCFWRTLLVLACIAAYFGALTFAMLQR